MSLLPFERNTLASPAWFVPYDDFARKVRGTGVSVLLDRFADGVWVPQDTAAVRTPSAAIAYPGLGARAATGLRHRARFEAAGYRPLYPADGEPFDATTVGVEFSAAPENTPEPRLVRLLPSAEFPYPPGVRTVHGVVVDAATRSPVANALVEARGRTSVDLVPWQERTLTGELGAFRLALRWDGEPGEGNTEVFRLEATERPGRTGSLEVRLPAGAATRHVIEIREQ
ncbi:carboxypeptidase regulatory-like domain-containing protein [Amycolatopsis sp. NPDC051102]|uniref:carboxypeptidase regulatory-like domain-containing protein n=1 Tax=Amycolatopsis sp. NPDC051102 TaxID=3155163 RepID=UPI0034449736